jgi:4-alpha-glucanotransferase
VDYEQARKTKMTLLAAAYQRFASRPSRDFNHFAKTNAEDLGIITPAVVALRDQFQLPGMRVLQFGFTADAANPHTPHNFIPHCFGYTATHDNDTTQGWYASLAAKQRQSLDRYMPGLPWRTSPAWTLIRILMASAATHAIVPLQDPLELGNQSRMNIPGQSAGNWEWRVGQLSSCSSALEKLADLGRLYNRQ